MKDDPIEAAIIESLKDETDKKLNDLTIFSDILDDTIMNKMNPLMALCEDLKNKIAIYKTRMSKISNKVRSLDINQKINTSTNYTSSGVQLVLDKVRDEINNHMGIFNQIPLINQHFDDLLKYDNISEFINKLPSSVRFRNYLNYNNNNINNISNNNIHNFNSRKDGFSILVDNDEEEEELDDDKEEEIQDINTLSKNNNELLHRKRHNERERDNVKEEKNQSEKSKDLDKDKDKSKESVSKKAVRKCDRIVHEMREKFKDEKISKPYLKKLENKILFEKTLSDRDFIIVNNENYNNVKLTLQFSLGEMIPNQNVINLLKAYFKDFIFVINNPQRTITIGGVLVRGLKFTNLLIFIEEQKLRENFKINSIILQAYSFFCELFFDLFSEEIAEHNLDNRRFQNVLDESEDIEKRKKHYFNLIGSTPDDIEDDKN